MSSTAPLIYTHTTPGESKGRLSLLQLYPRDMNIYGDWGNTLTLARRAQWHGYDLDVHSYDVGDPMPARTDLLVGGGGQDSGQERITRDLTARSAVLHDWAAEGVPMLVICGLYQLFGHYFLTHSGRRIDGVGLIDAETRAGDTRLIGNIVLETREFGQVVGYENHSGLTTLGPDARPFGRVTKGEGNNTIDGSEGARVDNIIGTYLHGSLLPKNPTVADWLLEQACHHAGIAWEPEKLDDSWEHEAHRVAASRPR